RQRGIVAGYRAQVDAPADAGIVEDLGNRIGQSAGTDVVDGHDRVRVAARPARVDHLLAAALHFRVVTLHRGEVELLGTRAGGDRRGGAAAEADQHGRAAEPDHRIAVAQCLLPDMRGTQVRESTSDHDRLVVAAYLPGPVARLFEGAEIAAEARPTELVVE